jgi:GTP-binding protein HflX
MPDEIPTAFVLVPVLKTETSASRTPVGRLEEAVSLARSIQLEVVESRTVTLSQIRPSTYIGGGVVEELQAIIAERGIGLVILDCRLTPVQQRNLEQAWSCKVIDRTGLILDIFGARARTREGKLQVELAALEYQKSRVVRSWTHLERQRGGHGFMGGPGERQIESDRRQLQERITKLKAFLETVKRTRELHRKTRREIPYPVVALVGYTNAGKSTLFNRMTGAEVFAEDQLFATLDPTLRRVVLPSGKEILLSDTVGFISNLPTHLVAAFRATLEEVLEADLLVHVRDIFHPETDAQKTDVESVLRDLGVDVATPLLEVRNKIDLAPDDLKAEWKRELPPHCALASAASGEGIPELLTAIEDALSSHGQVRELWIPFTEGALVAWLYRHGEVLHAENEEEGTRLTARLEPKVWGQFEQHFG